MTLNQLLHHIGIHKMMLRTNRLRVVISRRLLSSETERNCLISTANWKDCQYFSHSLTCDNNGLIFNKENLFEAATMDMKVGNERYATLTEYLSTISRNFQNSGNFEETIEYSKLLRSKVPSNSAITFVLGQAQKKTFLLLDERDNEFGTVFQVDAQKHGLNSLDSGLLSTVQQATEKANKNKSLLNVFGKSVVSSLSFAADSLAHKVRGFDVSRANVSWKIGSQETDATAAQHSNVHELVAQLVRRHGKVTVRVDNAEALFGSDQQKNSATLQLLQSLAARYSGKLRFVLTSEDTFLSYNLAGSAQYAGLSPKVAFLTELAPLHALAKLHQQFRVGKHLSVALVNLFGGHLGDCRAAVELLFADREKFSAAEVLDCAAVEHAVFSTVAAVPDSLRLAVRDTLQQLAATGFVPIVSPSEAVARAVLDSRLGFAVSVRDSVSHLDPALWSGALNPHEFKFALLPLKQSHRLAIHDSLSRFAALSNGLLPPKVEPLSISAGSAEKPAAEVKQSGDVLKIVGSSAAVVAVPIAQTAEPAVAVSSSGSSSVGQGRIEQQQEQGFVLEGYEQRVTRSELRQWRDSGRVSYCTLVLLALQCLTLDLYFAAQRAHCDAAQGRLPVPGRQSQRRQGGHSEAPGGCAQLSDVWNSIMS